MLLPEWTVGISFQICGSLFSNLGINVQSYAHKLAEQEHKSDPYYKNPLWVLGFGLFCLGEVLAGIAMGFAPQSLLAVISSYSLILNGIFHTMFTKSPVSPNYISSSIIVMFGSILVILSSTHKRQSYNLADLAALFSSWVFLIFFCFLLILLAILFIIRSILPQNPTLLITISSFMACISVLLAKCTMQLLKTSFLEPDSENQFLISFWPWVIMALFSVFAALNVHFMNLALKISKTTHVYPLYYAISTVLVILLGLAFFREYSSFTFWQSIFFTFGVSISLTGINLLKEDEDDNMYDDISPLSSNSSTMNGYPSDFFLKTSHSQADPDFLSPNSSQPWFDSTYQSSSANNIPLAGFDEPQINLSYSSLFPNNPTSQSATPPSQIASPVQPNNNGKIKKQYVKHTGSDRLANFFNQHQPS